MSNHTYRVIESSGPQPDGVDAAIRWSGPAADHARAGLVRYSPFEATLVDERSALPGDYEVGFRLALNPTKH